LADAARWDESFRTTTDAQWDQLAEAVRRDITAGATSPLERVFPTDDVEP
jgi:hypothetical protein